MTSPSDEYLARLLQALQRLPDERAARLVDEAWDEAEASVRETLTAAMRAALLRRTVSLLEGEEPGTAPRPDGRSRAVDQPASPPPQDTAGGMDDAPRPRPGAEVPDGAPRTGGGTDPDAASDPAQEADRARYVYGITPGGATSLPPDLAGVDPRFAVEVVSRDGLDAITSEVTLAEFGPDALRERLADRGWLEEKVRIHEHVVRFGIEADALVPMRFCTIVRDAGGLAGFLAEHGPRLRRTLADLAGKREWGVTVSTVPDRFEEHVGAVSDEVRRLDERAAAEGAGTAYFMDKRRQQLLEEEGERIASAHTGAWHERLAGVAARAAALPLRRRGAGDDHPSAQLVLNGAYLVDRAAEDDLAGVVDEIAGEGRAVGLAVALTGPWPAYSFLDDGVVAEVAE